MFTKDHLIKSLVPCKVRMQMYDSINNLVFVLDAITQRYEHKEKRQTPC